MSDIKQEIIFPNSGLNHDDDERFMPLGDSKWRRNILIGEDESNGLITNMLGCTRTVDIADHELYLSRYYKVIGSYYNRLTRKVYYFIFSQPYEIESAGGTSTTTTTTTESGDSGLVIDYTSGTFQYDNMLLEYVEDTQELNTIFRDSHNWFGLHWDYPMRDMCMIGDWLYFNPRVSEPKMIDVVRAYNYTNYDVYDSTLAYIYGDYVTFYGGLFRANTAVNIGETPSTTTAKWDKIGNSYQIETNLSGFDHEFEYAFNVIKKPPVTAPAFSYETDTTINSNNVRAKVFRFSYRYKYFDNSYSVYSAYSTITLSYGDEQWDGEMIDDVQLNNYIKIYVNAFSPSLVKEVEIVFQEIDNDWCICKTINRLEQDELTAIEFIYDFYNNEAYPIVDDSLIAKVADSVPRIANSEEIINKNILCYGGCTEGFNKVNKDEIDVTLTPELVGIDVTAGQAVPAVILRDNITNVDYRLWDDSIVYAWELNLTDVLTWGLGVDDVYAMIINGHYHSFSFSLADVATVNAVATRISNQVNESGVWESIIVDGSGNTWLWFMQYNEHPVVIQSVFFTPAVSATQAMVKTTGFKTGAFHPFCIFYYDKPQRRWEAHTSKDSNNTTGYTYDGTTVYVPMLNEISPVPSSTANRWVINWTVNHLPPTGAKYWRWGYAGNTLCTYFVQYIISDSGPGTDEEAHMTIVNITPLQTLKTTTDASYNQFPQSNIDAYTWQKGDRVRFITNYIANPATPGTELGALLDGMYDYEILKQDVANHCIYIQLIDDAALGIGPRTLIEIYRPNKSSSESLREYYEFGDIMPIIEDSAGVMVHQGLDTDQDTLLGTSASGTFGDGDVYHIIRVPSLPISTAGGETTLGAIHESQWWSDFYDSTDWNKGKIGVETSFGERYLNIIRYSNVYLQNTQINGLPTFEALSYKELNDVFGDIVAIYENGDTLKCYQERKSCSILIGRTEYTDTEGNTNVVRSTSILGAIRYSPSNYSTVFPESISRNNRYIYGFDIYNGVMWRDSANGIFPISGRYADAGGDSDYKMATWFKDKSKELLVSGISHVDVMTVWDEEFKLLYVTFVDYDETLNNATIVFHEPSNRWITFMDLEQTPPFHVRLVECPTYTIIRGFEGGLGFSFDEDTRFAVFNITTPAGFITVAPSVISMGMTANTPSGTGTGIPDGSQLSMPMMAYTPTVHVSSVSMSQSDLTWAADEYDLDDAQTITFVMTEAYVTISQIPTFDFWVTEDLIHPLGIGDRIYSGHTVSLYPISANTGPDQTGTFMVEDSYGNDAHCHVTQLAAVTAPTVTVQLLPEDTSGMTLSSASGSATVGIPDLSITFTPDHPSHNFNHQYDIYYSITKDGVAAGAGTISVRDERANVKTIYMTSNADYGDTIIVYLYGELIS